MKHVQRCLALAAAGLFGALLVASSDAQNLSRPKSTLTITERTEVPGAVLEPGTYVVKVADNQTSWNVISITNADETKTFATIMATPHTATDQAPNTLFVYYNTPSGEPRVLRSWWPPNDRFGQDFVYPRQRAEELARATSEKVPEMTAEMEVAIPPAPESQVTTTTTTTTETATTAAETGSTWRTEQMEEKPKPAETTTVAETTTTRHELPRTASPYGLLVLLGAGALGAGFAVRRVLA